MTSATDNRTTELRVKQLRELLDERGIEHYDHENGEPLRVLEKAEEPATSWRVDGANYCAVPDSKGTFDIWIDHCPPEQAIAVTLRSEPPYDELLHCLENDWHISASWDGLRKFWCIELTEEGVRLRDATHGTLTAEQVRDAIERHSAWVIGNNRCFRNGAYDAIADELNTCAERTCELKGKSDTCTKCGASVEHVTHSVYEMGDGFACHPNYCPNCGAKVVSE